jgi:hypothetical protein
MKFWKPILANEAREANHPGRCERTYILADIEHHAPDAVR